MEIIPHIVFGHLRVITVRHKSWFCGKDLATALAYKDSKKALARHVKDHQKCTYADLQALLEGGGETSPPPDVQPHSIFANESGMYSLVMGSKLPSAEAFKDWVCDDVLPALREFGRYCLLPEVQNELQLHNSLCEYARSTYPRARVSPGLGEMQDTSSKRVECWRKGYQRGQPDLVVHVRSGNFSGLVIELKTPKGNGVVSPPQRKWLDDMARAGYRTLVSNSMEECKRYLDNHMSNARTCCALCGNSFKTSETLRKHTEKYHPV